MKTLFFAAGLSAISMCTSAQSKSNEYHHDQDYKISPTGRLSLRCSDAKVTITGSARTTAHVKIDRELITRGFTFGTQEFSVDIKERSGDLDIRENSSSQMGMVGYQHEKYEIRIELPAGVSLSVNGDDGDFYVRNINGAISMSIDDGDIDLNGCTGNEFYFRMDDGDLMMDGGKGSLEIDADDADVEISNGQFESIVADVDDGDLVISTSLSDAGTYQIDSQDGLIALTVTNGGGEFSIRHDDGHVTATGNFETLRESEDYTELKLASGNAKVKIHADDARVKLNSRF